MQLVELTQSLGETLTEGLTDDSGRAPCPTTMRICEQKQGRGYSIYTMKNEQNIHGYELS